MADIHMNFSPRIITGSLSRIGSGVGNWGSHALLLADTALEDVAADIQDQLDSWGVRTIQFSREGLGCDILTLDDALSLARGSHARGVVALGGEGVMSLGRLVASAADSRLKADAVMENGVIPDNGLPLVEVPSSGTHSLMFLPRAFLADSVSGRSDLIGISPPQTHVVVADPTMPGRLTSGVSTLAAAVQLAAATESFFSARSNYLSDVQSRAALKTASGLLRRVKDEYADPDFRLAESENSVLSALSTGLTGPGPAMALAWAVSSAAGVSRTAALAVLLPWVLESPIYSGTPRAQAYCRLLADSDDDVSAGPADCIRDLFARISLPGRLRDLGAELDEVLSAATWAGMTMEKIRSDLNESNFRDILEIAT